MTENEFSAVQAELDRIESKFSRIWMWGLCAAIAFIALVVDPLLLHVLKGAWRLAVYFLLIITVVFGGAFSFARINRARRARFGMICPRCGKILDRQARASTAISGKCSSCDGLIITPHNQELE